MLVDLLH